MNELKTEKSPYLLQHADNPVEWYPWGDKAFNKAKVEDKPIFLSIGYSTCHWCHVMAHESFEDEEVAELMNEVFVSIKVDKEERPDIDKIYMTVCQLMNNSGGWPLTIIMTPDKKPFFAGTYFAKVSRFGRIGLIDLLNRVKELWKDKKDELYKAGDQIINALLDINVENPGMKLDDKTLQHAFNELNSRFDEKNGGFGGAPKFPTPHNLLFLLRFWNRTGNNKALEMVEKTIQAMRNGGIYDHIGFGFHRYSTDSEWLVPHFEKMLYDNALLAIVYLEAYQATKNPDYSKTGMEIFTYILRDMRSPEGGFYSAEDADSEGEEGKFYVWTSKEFVDILEKDEINLAKKVLNVEDQGNYLEEATKKKTGANILHLKGPLSKLAKEVNLTEQDLRIQLENIRQKLFKHRVKRVHPHKDDKILTDWNGLMIAALAKGAQILCEPLYLKAAKDAVDFILKFLRKPDGRLLHRYRDGNNEIDAYLDDYAYFIWGLLELYEATFDNFYLKTAIELNNDQIQHFWDEDIGGFFFTADDGEKLLTRQKEIYDGAIPSGNSVSMLNLLKLAQLTWDHDLEQKADYISRVFAESVKNNTAAYSNLMVAIDFAVGPTYTLVIAGDTESEDTKDMLNSIRKEFIPNKSIIFLPTEQASPEIVKIAEFAKYYEKVDNKAAAYICINQTCKPATNEVNKMLELLESKWI
ncbi:MAG: thioredoxin domain-containing protein [Promethearchaeota archaeon]|nr:MAG: thioredoxin domain-containing protein [Candidatus Lokiarchaeota archaeon]